MKNIDKFLHITMPDGSIYSVPVDYLWRVFASQRLHEARSKYIAINWDTVREFTSIISQIKMKLKMIFLHS